MEQIKPKFETRKSSAIPGSANSKYCLTAENASSSKVKRKFLKIHEQLTSHHDEYFSQACVKEDQAISAIGNYMSEDTYTSFNTKRKKKKAKQTTASGSSTGRCTARQA